MWEENQEEEKVVREQVCGHEWNEAFYLSVCLTGNLFEEN